MHVTHTFSIQGVRHAVQVDAQEEKGTLRVSVDGEQALDFTPPARNAVTGTWLLGPKVFRVAVARIGSRLELALNGQRFPLEPSTPAASQGSKSQPGTRPGIITAPMHGKLVELCVLPGDRVEPETVVAVLEAMKSRVGVRAGQAGVVKTVTHEPGEQVAVGDTLVELRTERSG